MKSPTSTRMMILDIGYHSFAMTSADAVEFINLCERAVWV